MSVREDLVIQADDVTIIQGDKVKDYNVIVTSIEGTPLSDILLTIAFYNNDYSFVNDITTNEYGIASVPLYLNGDSWFADVHFKGDENYKPQLVTKEITIEKFEILDTYIKSENLVINIDEQSMDGTYYTITLLDNYDRPIADEPVSIIVRQTGVEEPTTYVDMVLKTDKDGIIKVPFLSHDENVEVITEYKGCVRYKPCLNADLVVFEEVNPRNSIEFRFDQETGKYLEYRYGTGAWDTVLLEDYIYIMPYLNDDNNEYLSYDGWWYLEALGTEMGTLTTYRVTLCFEGMTDSTIGTFPNTYPFCRTFEYTPTGYRKELSEWIEMQGGSDEVNVEIDTTTYGDMAHIKLEFEYELPKQRTDLYVYGDNTYNTIPQYEYSDGLYKRTILEYDIILQSTYSPFTFAIRQQENPFVVKDDRELFDYYTHQLNLESTTRPLATLTQTGFGANSESYQSIDVIATSQSANMHDKVNEYYIMSLLNADTLEEFYFYSYLIDNVTSVHNEFNLSIGNWICNIVSKDTGNYQGDYAHYSATINNNSEITPPTHTIIANSENYINLGTDTPTFNDETISTATTDDDIHSIMALEFTNSNYYKLQFNNSLNGDNSTIIFGADPALETKDGLFINPNYITLWNDDTEIDTILFDSPIINQGSNVVLIQKYGTTITVFINGTNVYSTDLISWNTIGLYQDESGSSMTLATFTLEPYVVTDITPAVSDYDGTVFGSNIRLEIKDNQLDFVDYGMLPEGSVGGGKVILNDVPLQNANEYAIQLEMRYNNTRFERLNNLTGQMQMRVFEDISTSDSVKDYAKTLCSPMPVPNSKTVFTRHTDEGTLYFVKDPLNANSSFLSNAYNQYKGGVEIKSETGVSLFNLDNAYSPVFVGNELVRAEFHRRSGFIRLARYDENTGNWVNVNTLKLKNYPKLSLNEYNDDYAEIAFGNTTWKFYRGRPFIIVNHSQDELRIMDLVDRVYCETIENQRGMGYIMDYNPNNMTIDTDENGVVIGSYSTFDPQLSIQQFRQELHIGENIRLDNFEIYEGTSNKDIGDIATNSAMGILNIDNDNALQIFKDDTNLALNFPSYSHYVERINNTFTLSIGYIDCPFENITIKARGFDERGAVPVKDGVQYGIWEQIVNVTVDTTAPDSIRATFTGCPSEVKYIDFLIFFEGENSTDVILKDFMYYEGDAVINYDVDTSRVYAEQVEVHFADTYFANLYNDKDSGGLCIARPYQEPFSLRSIYASNETVLIPYMKKCSQWDKPEQVFLEYLNANRQIIDIDWEN